MEAAPASLQHLIPEVVTSHCLMVEQAMNANGMSLKNIVLSSPIRYCFIVFESMVGFAS